MTIARTTGFGSSTIDPNYPRFAVSGPSIQYPTQGMDVHKIGRTTGWMTGEVTGTCQDTWATDSLVRFCSYVTDYSSDLGDSGSPVFTWDGSSFTAELIGIHWGFIEDGPGYFSPYFLIMIEIDGELGGVVYAY